jgi:hypothetical protein
MQDAASETAAGSGPGPAHGTHIYPLYVTRQEPRSGLAPPSEGRPTLHFLDEPAVGRAVQDSFPGWGRPPAPGHDPRREDGSSGP